MSQKYKFLNYTSCRHMSMYAWKYERSSLHVNPDISTIEMKKIFLVKKTKESEWYSFF